MATKVKILKKTGDTNETIQVSLNHETESGLFNVALTGISDQHENTRKPINLVLCLDNSGSMSTAANIKKDDGTEESTGMSVLDIVRACATAIIESLSDKDTISIVKFNSVATCLLSPKSMDANGKTKAKDVLMNLCTEGMTNLMDGIKKSFDVLADINFSKHVNESIFILTDGAPNNHPNSPYLDEMRNYANLKFKNKRPCPPVTTFGFGYSLATPLLTAITDETGGRFVYIPDQGFVGTGMIHALSNCLSTATDLIKIQVEPINGAKFTKNVPTTYENISIKYNDTKNIVFPVDFSKVEENKDCMVVTVTGPNVNSVEKFYKKSADNMDDDQTKVQACRTALVDALAQSVELKIPDRSINVGNLSKPPVNYNLLVNNSTNHPINIIRSLVEFLRKFEKLSNNEENKKLIQAILMDILGEEIEFEQNSGIGQVKEALDLTGKTTNYYEKWGKHFIPSLLRAHKYQECNNFADPGIQNYGGSLFKNLREQINEIYDTLPPPKQSLKNQIMNCGGRVTNIQNMARYNVSGGCFSGNSIIKSLNKFTNLVENVKIKDLTKNYLVFDPITKNFEEIITLIEINTFKNPMSMIKFIDSGLEISHYHPILQKIGEKWNFPINSNKNLAFYTSIDSVYNLFTSGSSILANNVIACTLGHGLTSDEIINHEFLGNRNKIFESLKQFSGFDQGYVSIFNNFFKRNENDGKIIGIKEGYGDEQNCFMIDAVKNKTGPTFIF